MKKRFTLLLAMVMATSMMLTACGGGDAPAGSGSEGPSKETVSLKVGTGGTSGTYYGYGGVVANVLNSKLEGVQLNVQSTGASKANIFLIDDKEAEIAVVQNDVMDYAYNGTDLFAGDGAITSFLSLLRQS